MARTPSRTVLNRTAIVALPVSLVVSLIACSAADDVVLGSGSIVGSGGQIGVTYTGGLSSAGAVAGAGSFLSIPPGSGGSARNECASITWAGELLPTDVYVMFDQSSSMAEPLSPAGTETWWSATRQAFEALVSDVTFMGVSVGLQFFPLGRVAPDSCTADYATPEVPIAVLPGNTPALVAAIKGHEPDGFTPTGPALAGAIAHMRARAEPGRSQAVVLVTDGFPTECEPQQVEAIAEVARQGYESEAQVRTYVVGINMGSSGANMNSIAEAGGTQHAVLVDSYGDLAGALNATMRTVAYSPVPCEFEVPPRGPNDGSVTDLLTLSYLPPTGVEQILTRVEDEANCYLTQDAGWFYGGWYYVTSQATGRPVATLCPGVCGRMQPGKVLMRFPCN